MIDGVLDIRYSGNTNTLIGLYDTDINPTTYTNYDFLKYDNVSGWTNFYFEYDSLEEYSNSAATPVTVGGIAVGSTFSGKTMKEMWDELLYPYQVPEFLSFTIVDVSGDYEYGSTFTATSRAFNWVTSNSTNVSASTISISGEGITTVSNLDNGFTESIYMSAITNTNQLITSSNWNIVGTDTELNTFNKSLSIQWKNYIYYASSGETLTTGHTEVRDFYISDVINFKPANNFTFSYIIPIGNTYTAFYIAGGLKTISVKHVESSYDEKGDEFVATAITVDDGGGTPRTYHKYEQFIGGVGYTEDTTYDVIIS